MATSSAMNTSNDKIKYKITITQNSQSVANNTSNVTVSVRFYRTNTGYASYGTGTVYCKINGTQYSEAVTKDDKITSSGIVLFSKTLNIAHNADGTKTLATSAWIKHDVVTSSEQSYSQALTTIPRATTPTLSASSVDMGSSVTINMPRASSSFDHTLTYSFAGATGTIGTDLGISKAWTVPLSLASKIPSATSGTCTITCKTYNGTTLIGTKTVSLTVKVPSSVVPSISSVSVAEAVSGLDAQFHAYIQNKSKFRVVTSAGGAYASTIKTYTTTINGITYSGSTITSGFITKSGTVAITTTVTDSRGRKATKTTNVSVLAYSAPKIAGFTAFRSDASGVQTYDGQYITVKANFSISALNNLNAKSHKFEYKAKSGSEWASLGSGSVYSQNTQTTFTTTVSTESSFDVRLVVTDYFGSATALAELPTAFTLMDLHSGGRGIAFGKVSEIADEMEIDMDVDFYRNIQMGGWQRTDDEKNIYFSSSTSAQNVHNCKLYGGNGNSVTSIGLWDTLNSVGILRYLGGTKNLVIDAGVKFTRANGGKEFVTSETMTASDRSGRVRFSNGLLIQWGSVTITPSSANVPTSSDVTFAEEYDSVPMVITVAQTTAIGTIVTGHTASNLANNGFKAWVTRTNTTATAIGWIAIGIKK